MSSQNHRFGHRKRLRERFLAKEAIKRFGSFRAVLDAPVEELSQVPGIGEAAAVTIKLVQEAALLYLKPQTTSDLSLCQIQPDTLTLDNPQRLFDYCRALLGGKTNEEFLVIYLDARFRILSMETLFTGTINRATGYPRRVMEEALKRNAVYLVLVHNHPDGDTTPSEADKTVTRALVLAGKTLDITLYDHVIVSQSGLFSFREAGLL